MSHFKSVLGRLVAWMLVGRFRGWLVLLMITAPIAAVTLPALNGWLNRRAQARVLRVRDELPERTTITRSIDGKALAVCRDTQGAPFLVNLPLPEDVPLSGTVEHKLLARYSVRIEKLGAAETSAGYRADLLLIEIGQELNDRGEWRVTADLGIQQKPGQWARLPWWTKDGIAPSNELLRVERNANLMVPMYKISTPTTVEALLAYLRENWTKTAKSINPDYGKEPLAIKPKDFENDAVGPLTSVVPSDWSWLLILSDVFALNTVGGELQYLMFFAFELGIVVLVFRYLCFVAFRRPGLDPEYGRYMAAELGSTIIWLGLLGTVIFLSLAVLRLRISPSPAVMASIIASMANMMAQAFKTKLVSSSLQRILAWLEATVLAAENRAVQ